MSELYIHDSNPIPRIESPNNPSKETIINRSKSNLCVNEPQIKLDKPTTISPTSTPEIDETEPAKKPSSLKSLLVEEMDRINARAIAALTAGNYTEAASLARRNFALFQGHNSAKRSQELSKIVTQLEENTKAKVETYVGKKAMLKFGLEIGSAIVTAGAGFAGIGGGVVAAGAGALAAGGVIEGVAKAVSAGAQGVSYAGQAGTSAAGACNSFFEADRAGIDGAMQALRTEQDDITKKRESASGAKKETWQAEEAARNSRQQALRTIASN